MLGWFRNKSAHKKITEVHHTMRISFANLKEDMAQVSQWVAHFRDRHDTNESVLKDHASRLAATEERVGHLHGLVEDLQYMLELKAAVPRNSVPKETSLQNPEDMAERCEKIKQDLPPSQYRVCYILAQIQAVNPSRWTSQKDLAAEMYARKDYASSRSAIAQLVNILAVEGLIEKKKVNRSVYVALHAHQIPLFIESREPKE